MIQRPNKYANRSIYSTYVVMIFTVNSPSRVAYIGAVYASPGLEELPVNPQGTRLFSTLRVDFSLGRRDLLEWREAEMPNIFVPNSAIEAQGLAVGDVRSLYFEHVAHFQKLRTQQENKEKVK